LETGNKLAVQQHLTRFKERGVVAFDRVLSVPTNERIPALVKQPDGHLRVAAALTAAITNALQNINLRSTLTEDQIIELAGMIIEQSEEDNLALEDVLLFLQQLVSGKVGVIYNRMDIPTFFDLFESYRQERHIQLLRIREEQEAQYKAIGDKERISENDSEKDEMRAAIGSYLQQKFSNEGNATGGQTTD
jgi:hypothetical protein